MPLDGDKLRLENLKKESVESQVQKEFGDRPLSPNSRIEKDRLLRIEMERLRLKRIKVERIGHR